MKTTKEDRKDFVKDYIAHDRDWLEERFSHMDLANDICDLISDLDELEENYHKANSQLKVAVEGLKQLNKWSENVSLNYDYYARSTLAEIERINNGSK